MEKATIKALAMELYKNEEVAIELANIIFGIRDGDYEPEKFEFKFAKNETYVMNMESFTGRSSGDIVSTHEFGRYRKTKEGAELSLKRTQRANRLEMLVEYLGGLKEFVEGEENFYIGHEGLGEEWESYSSTDVYSPGIVYITEEVIERVCALLNSGAYSLKGE